MGGGGGGGGGVAKAPIVSGIMGAFGGGGDEGGGSAPAPQIVAAPSESDNEAQMKKDQQRAKLAAQGRSSLISSTLSDTSSANVSKKTLLGQ